MSPDLSHALTQFVNHATTLLDAGTAQLPAVLNDIVAYHLFDAWFGIFLGAGFLTIGVLGFIVMFNCDEANDWGIVGGAIGFLGVSAGLVLTLVGIYRVYYVTHFPRLVILDYLKEIVK